MFHPVVQAWFERRFGTPTPAQAEAWPAIAGGRDVLVTAPTGSGKTLAAFLYCLDRLVRRALDAGGGEMPDRTEVLYVSPLKALSNDVRRNLEQPLGEIADLAVELGHARPAVRTAVRTGDTTARERRAMTKRPPHVLVTTPESLFILLTSESGRRALRDVRTVIVDEIHAVATDKRGAHLALSIERLAHVVEAGGGTLQRIGLSATVNPLEVAARLLVGAGRPAPTIVDAVRARHLDLAIEILGGDELGAVCSNEQWGALYDRVAELAREHRSTLVFVNTRRLVERVALHLGERLGADAVAAHHGSLSRARRFDAEQRLKSGALRVVVATASLELGIDVGAVELTCLIGSPRSISTGLQRIGRSSHAVGGTPKGRLFPLTRDQLVECAALVRAARRGTIDRIALREAPLDILAQQIAAEVACEDWDEDALFARLRHAAPYAELDRRDFDAVLDMLCDGIATSRGRSGALVHRDAVGHRLHARRGARLAALTSGGAIPDTATYDVVLEPEGSFIGTVDEDFAVESMAGDVILLGNTSWRIRRVETGKVRVEDAGGAAPTIPFWLGEGPARTRALSAEVAALREEVASRLGDAQLAPDLQQSCALDRIGASLVVDYVAAGRAALGAVPTQTRVIAERFFDEAGGMQLVIHAPFGGRINRAWGMALRKRFCRTFDFELQAAATDDGIILSLSAQHSFPLETIFDLVRTADLDEVLTQAVLQAPTFETRWRWNAVRALALLRTRNGKRVPPHLQRMRAQDLMAAVFPAQIACQDNHGGGPIEVPDHVLVRETVRDCLCEAMDAAGFRAVLADIEEGRIECLARETPEPSVLSHEILNANPYAFLDDAPLEERRTRAVQMRRGLPAEVASHLGALDPEVVAAVVAEAQPDVRDADELHDLLLDAGGLPEAEGAPWEGLFEDLVRARRAARLVGGGAPLWVAAERRSLAAAVWPRRRFEPDVSEPPPRKPPAWSDREGALVEIVRARLGVVGPTTADILAGALGVPPGDVDAALARVELEGSALRGQFLPSLPGTGAAGAATGLPPGTGAAGAATGLPPGTGAAGAATGLQWCDRRLLARIHRRTLDGLRRQIEPVTAAELVSFLLGWQHVGPERQLHGRAGVAQVIGQLQGFEMAAGAWEREVLPARVARYDTAWMDDLCLSGEVSWGRLSPREAAGAAPTRAALVGLAFRKDLPWLLAPRDVDDEGLSPPARDVLAFLRRAGASFLDDVVPGARRLRAEVEDALWELVSAGRITGDGFAGLRALISTRTRAASARARFHQRWRHGGRARVAGAGRWSVLAAPGVETSDDERVEAFTRQLLRRYGVVFRDLLARETHLPPWRDVLRFLRRLEMRGEVRGGRLVGGFIGEQFALPEALEALRAVRKQPKDGAVVRVSACDPLNLVGIVTPGPRVPATLAHHVAYRDGVPIGVEPSAVPARDAGLEAAAG